MPKKKRSKIEKVLQTVTLKLAGETVSMPVKALRPMAEFRGKLGEMIADLIEDFFAKGGSFDMFIRTEGGEMQRDDIVKVIKVLAPIVMGKGFDHLLDLFYAYAPDLREKYEHTASDAELVRAGLEVLSISLPLAVSIGIALKEYVEDIQTAQELEKKAEKTSPDSSKE